MKKYFYLIVLAFVTSITSAQLPNNNMYVLKHLDQHPIPPQYNAPWNYAAIWGYVDPNGREYAILACGLGTSFVDVTDSADIHEVDFFPATIDLVNPDEGNLWRELKVYSHYAYVVSEADTSGIEIFNLQYLPDSVTRVGKFFVPGHRSTHSISQEGPYLYLNGGNAQFGHGTVVVDITNPVSPVLRGKWDVRYVHDCRVLRDTIFAMNINSGDGQITVIDARNKDSLRTITQWLNLPNPAPHNCALTTDRKFLYATDEVGPIPRLLKVWNIEDLTNVTQVTTWQPTGITSSIVHNVEIYGDTAVIAHYTAGVRVLNISNPQQPVEIAWYDTYPQNNNNIYQGCWGVYRFPSGKIAASDMNTGLYVLKVGQSVGINENLSEANTFLLKQNYPNPFNPETVIGFELSRDAFVTLKVFDAGGREIDRLLNSKQQAGSYKIKWDASHFAAGVYYYELKAGEFSETRKMVLLK